MPRNRLCTSPGHRETPPCRPEWTQTRRWGRVSVGMWGPALGTLSCLDVSPLSLHNCSHHAGDPCSPRCDRVGRSPPPPGQSEWPLASLEMLQQGTWVPSHSQEVAEAPGKASQESGGHPSSLLGERSVRAGPAPQAALPPRGLAGGPVTCAFPLVLSPPERARQ